MSTGTSSVLVLYYVDDCNFYLSDDNCNRTLDYFGWSQYSADTKENMGIADLYNGLYGLYNNDCLTVSEHQSKVFSHTIADKMKFMETYFDNILFQIRVSESIVVDDIASRIMYWEMSKDETVSVNDCISNETIKNIVHSIAISEYTSKSIESKIEELVSMLEEHVQSRGFIIKESLSISDSDSKKMISVMNEILSLSDLNMKNSHRTYMEAVVMSDYQNTLYYLKNSDTIGCNDVIKSAVQIAKEESIKATELYYDNMAFIIHCIESMWISDDISRNMDTVINDYISVFDEIINHPGKQMYDSMSISDDYAKVFESVRVFSETISHADSVIRSSDVVISDDIQFVDTVSRDVSHVLYDCFTVDESLNRSVDYVRLVDEMASIGDTIQNYTGKNVYVLLSLYDSYVRASNAIIESIIASNTALSTSDFTSILNKNPVYEEFSDFNVGDYEYENAIVRLKIISNATHSQPLVYDVSAHVDIDDTNDKGQTEITDTAKTTKIHYNKHYYNAPEVQVTLCGGTGTGTITPHIVTTDGNDDNGRYFEIALYDTSGNMTTGTISWVAKGW